MVNAIVFDFSRVLIDVKDYPYQDSLNARHKQLQGNEGYNIFDHFELNNELLSFADSIKDKYNLYIFTTGVIHEEKEVKERIRNIFKKAFTTRDFNLYKDNPEAYIKLAQAINKKPEEILFIDDTEVNINAAQKGGYKTILFRNNMGVINSSDL